MGEIPNVQGAYVSTGHNCWGILWAPVSGLAMAQLVAQGSCDIIDISAFAASRFLPRVESKERGRKKGGVDVGEQW